MQSVAMKKVLTEKCNILPIELPEVGNNFEITEVE